MIKEITTFVAQKSADPLWSITHTWIIGTNLFAGHVPVKNFAGINIPIRYLAVLENAGGAVLSDVGGVVTVPPRTPPSAPGDVTYFPKYVEKAVQLLNRAKSYFVARQDAEDLYEALHQTAGWNLPIAPAVPLYNVIVIDAYGPPAPIENPGASGLFTFSCNYTWKIEEI
ncbi:MAG: hypothetical protein KAV87_54285 [Desulfobacteraceae bacterium]|nr:hypothetical protein [Desulfobacteraceae bacterium]